VAERHVDGGAEAATFLGRGHERRALFDRLAQRRAELRVKDRGGVFEFARFADDGGLAVALRFARRDAERLNALVAEQAAEFFADGDQRVEVFFITAGERVVDHGHRECTARRRLDRLAHLDAGFVHLDDEFSDLRKHVSGPLLFQRRPFHCAISTAFSPPTRACTRAPVLITRKNTISSGSGAPGTRTSIASKWLRT